jgi:peptidyl-prolyl cis-trans isomerase D
MLEMFRRGAQGWVAKIFFGILVLSFALWGVADVFRGYGDGALAKVGKTEISTADFQTAFNEQVERVRRRYGRNTTVEQARMLQADQQALSQVIGSTAIGNHAAELKLGMSEQAVADKIKKDPTFASPDGKFNRGAFESALRQAGLSERGFMNDQRKGEVRQQLTEALQSGGFVPAATIDLLHKFREETRAASYLTLDPAKIVKLPDADDAKLKETYETSKKQFVTPEQRKLAVLILTGAEVKKRTEVTEADIKAVYDADKERFDIPEKRRLQQIAFPDKAAAEAGLKALSSGKSFLEVAKAAGAKDSDVDFGLMTKKELIDQKIAAAAFALPKDKVSAVIEGAFATALVRVVEIQAGKQRTLDDVKGEIRDKLATEKSNVEIQKLQTAVEDSRAAGKTLKETADALKMTFNEIAATDRKAKAPDGKAVLEGPDGERLVAAAFESKIGVESEAVELSNGGVAWVDVMAITPEAQRPFEDVKVDVKALWTAVESKKALSAAAAKLVERLQKGETLDTLAKELGAKVETATGLRRNATGSGLPDGAVAQAFAVANGGSASAETADGKTRVVLRVTGVNVPPPATKEQAEKLKAEVQRQMQYDVMSSYVLALQDRQGVTINQAAVARALGADRQQQQ